MPDRERQGNPIKRICRECHAQRLTGDLRTILDKTRARNDLQPNAEFKQVKDWIK